MYHISRPSSGPSSPRSCNFDSLLTDWRMNHLIQLLEGIKDKDVRPKWKSPRHVYLSAVRDLMSPSPPSTRRSSVSSYEDEDTDQQSSDTTSTPTSIESDIDEIVAQARKPKRKLSFTLCTSDDEREAMDSPDRRKRRCSIDWSVVREEFVQKGSEESQKQDQVQKNVGQKCSGEIRWPAPHVIPPGIPYNLQADGLQAH